MLPVAQDADRSPSKASQGSKSSASQTSMRLLPWDNVSVDDCRLKRFSTSAASSGRFFSAGQGWEASPHRKCGEKVRLRIWRRRPHSWQSGGRDDSPLIAKSESGGRLATESAASSRSRFSAHSEGATGSYGARLDCAGPNVRESPERETAVQSPGVVQL